MQVRNDVPNVMTHNMLMDLDVQLARTNVKIVISLVILVACAMRRDSLRIKGLWNQEVHSKHINYRLVQFACKIPYVAIQMRVQVMTHFWSGHLECIRTHMLSRPTLVLLLTLGSNSLKKHILKLLA